MTSLENLLDTGMEECAEVIQAISKVLRFGQDAKDPAHPESLTNGEKVVEEYYQLVAVMEMLFETDTLRNLSDEEIHEIKTKKRNNVLHHQLISMQSGRIDILNGRTENGS